MTTPELRTERLLMRGWREADKPAYAAINADPEVMRHFPSTLTREQSDEMVDRMRRLWAERGMGLWAVERLDTGELVGFVGLSVPSFVAHFTPCVEIGWRLGRAHWGNGFAPEAASVALDWAWGNLHPPRGEIVSFTSEANTNSRRVMEKLGMHRDPADDFDHPLLPDWAGRRHVLYRLRRPAGVAP